MEQDAHDPNVPRADNRVNEGIARKALSGDGSQYIFTVALHPGKKGPGGDDFFVFSLPARGSRGQQKDVQIGDFSPQLNKRFPLIMEMNTVKAR
jgi:hypothetical protein